MIQVRRENVSCRIGCRRPVARKNRAAAVEPEFSTTSHISRRHKIVTRLSSCASSSLRPGSRELHRLRLRFTATIPRGSRTARSEAVRTLASMLRCCHRSTVVATPMGRPAPARCPPRGYRGRARGAFLVRPVSVVIHYFISWRLHRCVRIVCIRIHIVCMITGVCQGDLIIASPAAGGVSRYLLLWTLLGASCSQSPCLQQVCPSCLPWVVVCLGKSPPPRQPSPGPDSRLPRHLPHQR